MIVFRGAHEADVLTETRLRLINVMLFWMLIWSLAAPQRREAHG